MLDYIIVGAGLAGISFAEVLLQNDKSFVVFENNSQHSSRVAGGLYNPVILKRFTEAWNAQKQVEFAFPFYKEIETRLDIKFDFKIPIYRKFFSVEEQNNWFTASDKPSLTPFLSTNIIQKKYKFIDSPFGYGEVFHTGFIDTNIFLDSYLEFLKLKDSLIRETFKYDKLIIHDNQVSYGEIKAKHIVFAEGFGLHSNPYFNYLPLDGTKGELLVIKAEKLELDAIVKTGVFILPLGNHLFKVGATYNWEDKSNNPTVEGKQELVDRIKEILNCDFEIIDHLAEVRPTVKDRRPLLGTHPKFQNLHVLNGLGTRGVMLGPSMAMDLFDYIEKGKPLDKTINISRFKFF